MWLSSGVPRTLLKMIDSPVEPAAAPPVTRRCLGVFQGGGARGVAYAGALAAFRRNGMWFDGVAGASAGAITAALVAAGYLPPEITRNMLTLLTAAGSHHSPLDRFALLPGRLQRLRRYDSLQLQQLINELLCRKLADRGITTSSATFADLFRATDIECTIVALNVTVGQPAIFNHHWTPTAGVAAAVVASSAIPVAFSPALGFQDFRYMPPHGAIVHVLVDGGAWANYPQFVFRDRSFRRFHRMPDVPADSEIIGFVLTPSRRIADEVADEEKPFATWLRRRTVRMLGVVNGSGADIPGVRALTKTTISGWRRLEAYHPRVMLWCRLVIVPLAPLFMLVLAALLALDLRRRGDIVEIGLDISPATVILCVCAALWPTLTVLARAAGSLLGEGAATAKSLLGAATGVPVWSGLVTDDMVIFVPDGGVDTTDFNIDHAYVSKVVATADHSSAQQLAHYLRTGRSIASDEYKDLQEIWELAIKDGSIEEHSEAPPSSNDTGSS